MRALLIPSSFIIWLLIFFAIWIGGSSEFSPTNLWQIFHSNGYSDSDREMLWTVFFSIRLPRLLVASLCGAALSAAGVLSQGLFRNPLASPSVLGASAGGVLGAILVFYFVSPWLHWLLLPLGAFAATLLTMGFVLMLFRSLRGTDSSQLLICGFAITTLLGACTSLLLSFMLPQMERTLSLLRWMMGGFSGRGWIHFSMALGPALMGSFFAFRLVRKLDVLSFGEELASSLNITIPKLQVQTICAIALLVAASVAVAGALPFVGLMVPHVCRSLCGPMHRSLLLLSMIWGMILLLLADALAQKILFPRELEVGTLTSILGVVFFFIILLRKPREQL